MVVVTWLALCAMSPACQLGVDRVKGSLTTAPVFVPRLYKTIELDANVVGFRIDAALRAANHFQLQNAGLVCVKGRCLLLWKFGNHGDAIWRVSV